MTTDYKNLSFFEASAVFMIVVGIALIGFQVFVALPEHKQEQVLAALQVFEMSDAIVEVIETEMIINDLVFNGMEEFHHQFQLAFVGLVEPVGEEVAYTLNDFAVAFEMFSETAKSVGDTLASNYQSNYALSGVETSAGGKVMGAYFEKFAE